MVNFVDPHNTMSCTLSHDFLHLHQQPESAPVVEEICLSKPTNCGSGVFPVDPLRVFRYSFLCNLEPVHEERHLVFAIERGQHKEEMERQEDANFMRLLSGKRNKILICCLFLGFRTICEQKCNVPLEL